MAPKSKGGKKAKEKVDESPEERMARLEKEAYEIEERERSQTEANRVALRARQLREQQYSKFNGIKIHNQWRKIMRMAKVDQLRRQIEILSQNHEREVDRKDAIIQMLNRDLEDADEQYETALRGHLRVVDGLLDLQYQRMKAMEEAFHHALSAVEQEFDSERLEITNAHNKHKKDMNDMRGAMEAEFQDAENDIRQDFEAQREEIKNKNSEDYNVLKISLESSIDELEKYFEQAHTAYLQSTEQHTNTFKELTKNDANAARVIEMRMRKLQRLQEALKHWRAKIQSNSREWEERNRSLFNEKQIMNKHYQTLKTSMDSFRAQQSERLKQLSIQSGECGTALSAVVARAENMLKLAEMCRKLETEQEKILPFHSVTQAVKMEGEPNDLTDVELELQALRPSGPRDTNGAKPAVSCKGVDETGRQIEEWDYLNRFFRRFNKALLDKVAIDRESQRLQRENDDLRAILKQYLDGISVNEDVMNNPLNPLLVVNNRLQLTLRERDKARQVILERHAVEQVARSH